MQRLKLRTISALQWSVVAQAATVATGVALTVLLARLLSPRDFGLIGMVAVFTGFLSFFVDMGFGPAIIQKQECLPEQVNAAFWANLLLGGLITLALVLLAPAIALFYREPRLAPLVTVLAFNYLLSSVFVIRNALLRKEMKFRDLARIEIGANLVSALSALSLALSGFGVWSLVAQHLVLSLATALIGWDALSWRPSLSFSLRPLKGLLRFSTNMFGANVVNYWMRNADNMLIGRYIGAAALGIYSRAYTLMLLPLTQVTAIMGRVMVPALSSIQHDRPRVKEICLHAMRNISLVTFPLMLGLF
ncbi:MAG: lipopolysaccharide biosynthesis protein, partial [Endomicrobiales bacterium]